MPEEFAQFFILHVVTDLLHALVGAYKADLLTLPTSGGLQWYGAHKSAATIAMLCTPMSASNILDERVLALTRKFSNESFNHVFSL